MGEMDVTPEAARAVRAASARWSWPGASRSYVPASHPHAVLSRPPYVAAALGAPARFLLPITLPASRHRSHASVMPLVPPCYHSLHRMSAHDIRRALTARPITSTSIHVACSFHTLFPPLRLIVPRLRAPALPRATRCAPRPVGRRAPARGAPSHRRARSPRCLLPPSSPSQPRRALLLLATLPQHYPAPPSAHPAAREYAPHRRLSDPALWHAHLWSQHQVHQHLHILRTVALQLLMLAFLPPLGRRTPPFSPFVLYFSTALSFTLRPVACHRLLASCPCAAIARRPHQAAA